MFRHSRLILLSAALFVAACASTPKEAATPTASAAKPAAASLSGTWDVNTQSPMGERASSLTLAQAGAKLTGSMASEMGDLPITGTVTGTDVAFSMNVSAMGQDLKIDYTGKVAGDTMSGKFTLGSYGEGTFTAKKKS